MVFTVGLRLRSLLIWRAYRSVTGLLLFLIALSSAMAAPGISFDRTRVDFSPPDIMVGKSSREFLIRVSSTGTDSLKLQRVEIGGQDAGDFRLGGCTSAAILPPGGWCDVQVGFVPLAPGPRSAVLLIYNDDPKQGRVTIPLAGNALAATSRLDVSPASLDFGVQPPGVASTAQRLTVRSTGTLQLTVASVTAPSSGEFTLSQNCTAAPLPPRGFCFIDIQFVPNSGGARVGTLTISSDDPLAPTRVELKGVGAYPAIAVTPPSLNVGSAEIGTNLTAHGSLVISNTGGAALNITSVSVTGGNAPDFAVAATPCTAQPVQPGAACTVALTFRPRASGSRAATVIITSDALGATTTLVPASGFGEFVIPAVPAVSAADDHRFVTATPTAACTGNPATLAITAPISRALGVGGVGPAVAAGTLSATATLELMVWDAGSAGTHSVSINGTSIGGFAAQSGGWILRSLPVPTGLLLFPGQAPLGFAPTPAANQVVIRPDTTNVGLCVVVAWARLSFLAMSPVILVHGNNSDGGFFRRQTPSFVAALNAAGIPNDSSINLGPPVPVATNGIALQSRILPIVRSFGVNSVHVVAHSKGGLDTRAWLSMFASSNAAATAPSPRFRVLSLTTLATPHLGSALADLQLAIEATSVGLFGIQFAKVPTFTAGSDLATPDLTTFAGAFFNPPLPLGVDYRMLGGDTDLNGDGAITSAPPDEYAGARIESGQLTAIFTGPPLTVGATTIATGPQMADAIVTSLYQFLRNMRAVGVGGGAVALPTPVPPFFLVVTVTFPVPIPGPPAANDLLVTIASANGGPPPFGLAVPLGTFTGAAGRNHGSIGDGGVAAVVIPLLKTTDMTIGDFR